MWVTKPVAILSWLYTFFTTDTYYDELLIKVEKGHYFHQKNQVKYKNDKTLSAPRKRCVRAVWAPWARRKHAAATSYAPSERHGCCTNAVRTSCGRCRDAVRTLYACCYWPIWYFRHMSRWPHRVLTGFRNAIQTLWHRRLVSQVFKCR